LFVALQHKPDNGDQTEAESGIIKIPALINYHSSGGGRGGHFVVYMDPAGLSIGWKFVREKGCGGGGQLVTVTCLKVGEKGGGRVRMS
jgi:hypothetical protein